MISYVDIALSSAFVAVALAISGAVRLKLERDIIEAAVRAFVQLVLVGFVLRFIFARDSFAWTGGMMLAMTLIGAFTAGGRAKAIPRARLVCLAAMLVTVVFTVAFLLAAGIVSPKPMYIIPIAGMAIGFSMNAVAVSLIRLREGIYDERERIEVALALGKPPSVAVARVVKRAMRLAMIPRLDIVRVAGIIQMPGAMVGMILAGASPLEAAKFQIVIMNIVIGAPALASFISTSLAYRQFFTPAEQLLLPGAVGTSARKREEGGLWSSTSRKRGSSPSTSK